MAHVTWLEELFEVDKLKKVSNILAKQINKDKDELNIAGIAFTGVSGIIAPILSVKTNLPLICVRKLGVKSHSGYSIEYSNKLDVGNCIIVDDFLSTGTTIIQMVHRLKEKQLIPVKVYFYNGYLGDLTTATLLALGINSAFSISRAEKGYKIHHSSFSLGPERDLMTVTNLLTGEVIKKTETSFFQERYREMPMLMEKLNE